VTGSYKHSVFSINLYYERDLGEHPVPPGISYSNICHLSISLQQYLPMFKVKGM
jgi:hypothetical protein